MIKLLDILREIQEETEDILISRRSSEEREKNYLIATQKKIQQYIKDGSQGDLNLSGSPIKSLPDNFKVGGYLDLENCTSLQSLPNDLEVGGYLDLSNMPIKSLPDNLKVGSNLNLVNCISLESLPNGLEVKGHLDLRSCTSLESLPNGLKVKHFLNLEGCTNLQSLPKGLKVGGYLNLRGTPLAKKYTKEEIRKMVPNLKGNIYL
jgi:hypothetical protein